MWTLSVAAHALALRVFCVCFLGSFFVRIFLDPVLPSGLGRGRNWLRIAAARKSPPVAGCRRRAHLSRRPPKGPGRALGFRRGRRREGTRKPPGRGAWWGSTDWMVRARSGSRIRECRRAVLCPRVHREGVPIFFVKGHEVVSRGERTPSGGHGLVLRDLRLVRLARAEHGQDDVAAPTRVNLSTSSDLVSAREQRLCQCRRFRRRMPQRRSGVQARRWPGRSCSR